MAAHYVYRIFDTEGRLIYVGCTRNLFQRMRFHQVGYTAWWNDQIAKVTAKVFPTKEAARREESRVIRDERPRWNITGKWATNSDWTEAEFEDFITALMQSPEFGPGTLRRARRVAAAYALRFGHEVPIDISDEEVA